MPRWVVLPWALAWMGFLGCKGGAEDGHRQAAARPGALVPLAAPTPAVLDTALPTVPFVAPEPFRPVGGGPAQMPPDLGEETWRAFVEQGKPLQRKTPTWQALPASETVELSMPAGSLSRCLVTPVTVTPRTDEWGSELLGWTLSRELRCSGDGFVTFQAYPQHDLLHADGRRESLHRTQAYLSERGQAGDRELIAIVRSDRQERLARTGPPRIVEPMAQKGQQAQRGSATDP